MIGLGTIANTAAVILGGVLGNLLKNGIAERYQKILMQSLGLATIFIGISGVLRHMLVIENSSIATQGQHPADFQSCDRLPAGSVAGHRVQNGNHRHQTEVPGEGQKRQQLC